MCHKADAFDWTRFEAEFRDVFERVLASGDVETLSAFIDENRAQCRDPNEGEPLPNNCEN